MQDVISRCEPRDLRRRAKDERRRMVRQVREPMTGTPRGGRGQIEADERQSGVLPPRVKLGIAGTCQRETHVVVGPGGTEIAQAVIGPHGAVTEGDGEDISRSTGNPIHVVTPLAENTLPMTLLNLGYP